MPIRFSKKSSTADAAARMRGVANAWVVANVGARYVAPSSVAGAPHASAMSVSGSK